MARQLLPLSSCNFAGVPASSTHGHVPEKTSARLAMPFDMSKAGEHRVYDADEPPLRQTVDPAIATTPQGETRTVEFGREFRTRGSARSRFKAVRVLAALATATGLAHGQSLSPVTDGGRLAIKLSAFNIDSRIQLRAGGNADYEGRPFSSPWHASGEFRRSRNFGVHVGYDWFRYWRPARVRPYGGPHRRALIRGDPATATAVEENVR